MSSIRWTRRTFTSTVGSFVAAAFMTPRIKALGFAAADPPRPREQASHQSVYAVDFTHSPHAKFRSVPLNAVTVDSGFWSSRIAANQNSGITEVYQQEMQNGRLFNFQRLDETDHGGLSIDLHSLRPGADSEVYKWLEGAGWALTTPDPALQMKVNQVVQDVVRAQEPSGYLDTYFVGVRIPERMKPETQIIGHEIYSMGHLIQAGIALYRVTGNRTLLEVGLRFVDDYLLASFGPEPDKLPLMSGHPGPEMMLVELYRETGDSRYLRLAGYLLQGDRRITVRPDQAIYTFAGKPFTSRTVMEGHAVRAVYACCGAADYALETGDPDYIKTLHLLWEDMTKKQMYITGGIGAMVHNEAFGGDYVLPNQGSYCESCANIGVFQLAYRMLALTGQSTYGDVLERVLYNSVNSGMALDGLSFNYRNPSLFRPALDPKVRRPFWYVNCCAPNLNRTFSSLRGYFYSSSPEGVYVHLYDNSQLRWHLEDGTAVVLSQKTTYPWGGTIDLSVEPDKPTEFTIFLRIPEWADGTIAMVNGTVAEPVVPGQYLSMRRKWSHGDNITLNLNMTPRLIVADPAVEATRGRIAVQRGPLVYCMESIDQPKASSLDDLIVKLDASLATDMKEEFEPQLLGGIVSISMNGVLDAARVPNEGSPLYAELNLTHSLPPGPVTLRLIPYYAFANREESPMQVWLSYTRA
jgi:DUF1680 family protein